MAEIRHRERRVRRKFDIEDRMDDPIKEIARLVTQVTWLEGVIQNLRSSLASSQGNLQIANVRNRALTEEAATLLDRLSKKDDALREAQQDIEEARNGNPDTDWSHELEQAIEALLPVVRAVTKLHRLAPLAEYEASVPGVDNEAWRRALASVFQEVYTLELPSQMPSPYYGDPENAFVTPGSTNAPGRASEYRRWCNMRRTT